MFNFLTNGVLISFARALGFASSSALIELWLVSGSCLFVLQFGVRQQLLLDWSGNNWPTCVTEFAELVYFSLISEQMSVEFCWFTFLNQSNSRSHQTHKLAPRWTGNNQTEGVIVCKVRFVFRDFRLSGWLLFVYFPIRMRLSGVVC